MPERATRSQSAVVAGGILRDHGKMRGSPLPAVTPAQDPRLSLDNCQSWLAAPCGKLFFRPRFGRCQLPATPGPPGTPRPSWTRQQPVTGSPHPLNSAAHRCFHCLIGYQRLHLRPLLANCGLPSSWEANGTQIREQGTCFSVPWRADASPIFDFFFFASGFLDGPLTYDCRLPVMRAAFQLWRPCIGQGFPGRQPGPRGREAFGLSCLPSASVLSNTQASYSVAELWNLSSWQASTTGRSCN